MAEACLRLGYRSSDCPAGSARKPRRSCYQAGSVTAADARVARAPSRLCGCHSEAGNGDAVREGGAYPHGVTTTAAGSPQLADVRRLGRRLLRLAVRAARAEDEPVQQGLLSHLGPGAAGMRGGWRYLAGL